MSAIRVLVVDDSSLLRKALRAFFESSKDFVVIGEAATGRDAVEKVASLAPDLVTMDLEMPDMDGLQAIERIMADRPTPILVVTGDPAFRGMNAQFEALARGAIDLIEKPSDFPGTADQRRRFLDTARLASSVKVLPHIRGLSAARRARRDVGTAPPVVRTGVEVVVMAASTGGPGAIRQVLAGVEASRAQTPPVVVVQHMHQVFAEGFIEWLRASTRLRVREARRGLVLERGWVYVAVRGEHVAVTEEGEIDLAPAGTSRYRPSADMLFSSAARAFGARSMGILLTGMGEDGAAGLEDIFQAGGLTIAQDEATSVVFGMPGAAVERGAARAVLPIGEIARVINDVALANREPRGNP